MRSRSHARFTRQRVEIACNSADMHGDAFLVTFDRVRPRQLAEIRAAAAPVSSVSVPSEDKQTPELVQYVAPETCRQVTGDRVRCLCPSNAGRSVHGRLEGLVCWGKP